jgi:hypothetical protein
VSAWCPRCDAVRPGQATCPACGTPLAALEAPRPPADPELPPPADDQPVRPAAPSRLRVALLVAVLVLGGLAFVAGRSGARPAPAATPATTTPATTTPDPEANLRELGWRARGRRGLAVTAVSIRRFVTRDRETAAELTLRVDGLQRGQELFALQGLRLLDLGGGVFSTPEEEPIGDQPGTPATPTGEPATYTVVTAPAPRLDSLAAIEVGALVVVRQRSERIDLDVGGAWPARRPLRAVAPGPRDAVTVPDGSLTESQGLPIRVAAVLVGAGRAVVALDAREAFGVIPGRNLPLTAELRAGDRVLCSRTVVLRSGDGPPTGGLVLACRTGPVPRLTVGVGAGVEALRLGVTLER